MRYFFYSAVIATSAQTIYYTGGAKMKDFPSCDKIEDKIISNKKFKNLGVYTIAILAISEMSKDDLTKFLPDWKGATK